MIQRVNEADLRDIRIGIRENRSAGDRVDSDALHRGGQGEGEECRTVGDKTGTRSGAGSGIVRGRLGIGEGRSINHAGNTKRAVKDGAIFPGRKATDQDCAGIAGVQIVLGGSRDSHDIGRSGGGGYGDAGLRGYVLQIHHGQVTAAPGCDISEIDARLESDLGIRAGIQGY